MNYKDITTFSQRAEEYREGKISFYTLQQSVWEEVIDLRSYIEKRKYTKPLFTASPKREWVGLTDEEIEAIVDLHTSDSQGYDIWCDGRCVAADVEAKLKEKNA